MIFNKINTNKLFSFEKDKEKGGYVLTKFAQSDYFSDPSSQSQPVTEITIPAKYRGRPVVEIGANAFRSACELKRVIVSEGVRRIGRSAFQNCKKLNFISLPSSLKEIGSFAFNFCVELDAVSLNSSPKLGAGVFSNDLKISARLILAGELGTFTLARPLSMLSLRNQLFNANPQNSWLLNRPDVLELALENNCLYRFDTKNWFEFLELLFEKGCAEQLRIIEESRAMTAALVDSLIEYSAERGKTEKTAYFLELKRRKFRFKKDDDFDL